LSAKDIIGLVLTIAGVIAASLGHLVHYRWFWLAGALLLPGCLLLFNAYRAREFLRSHPGGMDVCDSSGFYHGGHVESFPVADSHGADMGGSDGGSD
jgi:hypothetical protein